jgi:hypothetical protein
VVYKRLSYTFPSSKTKAELKKKEVPPVYEFVNATSKLADEIITEIFEQEIRLDTTQKHS